MKIKILVMSVGPYEKNGTARWLTKLGAEDLATICLPNEFSANADSYRDKGMEVFIYDEKKYINEDFEFFGFRPRNCGGVGRQGIAEAVDLYGDEYICFQLDDDTSTMLVREPILEKASVIKTRKDLEELIRGMYEFYKTLHIQLGAKTGATQPKNSFISNRKVFNNFLMDKKDSLKGDGFKALCSDDCRYNFYRQVMSGVPMISTELVTITFKQSQGDRNDGNAVLYNGDCSWKKSYSLKMMFPWCVQQRIKRETNRALFRENILASKVFPPICVADENGEIVGRAI